MGEREGGKGSYTVHTLTVIQERWGRGGRMDNFGVMSVGVRIRNPR